jgi:hypothetical protein
MHSEPIVQSQESIRQLQQAFKEILPRILIHAEICFRHVICSQRRQDLVAETVGLAWKWFQSLSKRGKDAREFVSKLAAYASHAARAGRCVCRQLRASDVMSEKTQRQRGFRVESLPISTQRDLEEVYGKVRGQQRMDAFEERLHHNNQTPIPDQVAFRCDFPAWLGTRTQRDRMIIGDMIRNEGNGLLAAKYGISRGRVSQLRRSYRADWSRFTGESPIPRPCVPPA